jgi:hypothetical protein
LRDSNYAACWDNLPKTFSPPAASDVPVRTFSQMGL